ncbi:MAG: zinc-binding alcohol dehydrogenase family protein [Nostoc desertorum CM1-VF14]|jgi:NADPH:quinone reductase-like Zn-dependent oxidoreductase|nr:zinc-binding alcohol dehydrogenase family protein [Nostoc desertorum CM1-VF14]
MKAAVIRKFGEPDVFEYVDIDTPEPKVGEVRIKILATGLNRIDHYLRLGGVNPNMSFPHILGSDAIGVIEANGLGSGRFQIGERVIPMPGYTLDSKDDNFKPMSAAPSYLIRGVAEWGTYAEYMVVPEKWLIKDETGLADELVATLPMPLVTCVRAIKVVGEVNKGDTVVIHGAASGTGSIGVQIAKALGARVAATIRTPEKEAFVKSLGADLVIQPYRSMLRWNWSSLHRCDRLQNDLQLAKALTSVELFNGGGFLMRDQPFASGFQQVFAKNHLTL